MPRPHGTQALSWWGAAAPPTKITLAAATYIGVTAQFTVPGRIMGARVYLPGGFIANELLLLWETASNIKRAARVTYNSTPGTDSWQQVWFRPTIRVNTTITYRLAFLMYQAYFRYNARLVSTVTVNGISFIGSFQTTSIDPILGSPTFTTNANGVDFLFQAD